MSVEEALAYIHNVCWQGSIPGLSRTEELLRRIGNPEKKLKFVHIGGTNGKGSTAAMTASILQAAGYRTGLYTSPYILRFHERMQVNGIDISDEELADITALIRPHADAMTDHPTEFELVSCIAFEYFKRQQCDIVVLEVGMGGEMDSTNVIEAPEVAAITNIGLDHTEFLGDTLEKIAETKSGIIKKGGRAVLYRSTPSVEQVIAARCNAVGATLHKADFDSIILREHSLDGQTFDAAGYQQLKLPLLGGHQLKNAAVVLAIIHELQQRGYAIEESHIRDGLQRTRWPGRFEVLRHAPLFLVDGGHNPQCIEALVQNIESYLPGRPLTILTGVLADKDFQSMYQDVARFACEFITVTPPSPRAMPAETLREYLLPFGKPVTACAPVAQGVQEAIARAGKDGIVLAYGSLYMVADIRAAAN